MLKKIEREVIDVNGLVICGIEDASGTAVAGVARELANRYRLPLLYVHVLKDAEVTDQAERYYDGL